MRSSKLSAGALALLAVVGLAACESTDKTDSDSSAAMGVMNNDCPIMGGPIDESAGTASYHGAEIGFCCGGCVSKWDSWSDAQKSEYVSSLK